VKIRDSELVPLTGGRSLPRHHPDEEETAEEGQRESLHAFILALAMRST
jgi:hypothetical protein